MNIDFKILKAGNNGILYLIIIFFKRSIFQINIPLFVKKPHNFIFSIKRGIHWTRIGILSSSFILMKRPFVVNKNCNIFNW